VYCLASTKSVRSCYRLQLTAGLILVPKPQEEPGNVTRHILNVWTIAMNIRWQMITPPIPIVHWQDPEGSTGVHKSSSMSARVVLQFGCNSMQIWSGNLEDVTILGLDKYSRNMSTTTLGRFTENTFWKVLERMFCRYPSCFLKLLRWEAKMALECCANHGTRPFPGGVFAAPNP
jgi:hypothetical protein